MVVVLLGSGAGLAAVIGGLKGLALFQQERAKGILDETTALIAQSKSMREDAIAEYERTRTRLVTVLEWGRRGWAKVRELGQPTEPEP